VTWATSVPILVFLGLCSRLICPIYATDVRQRHRLMPPPRGRGIISGTEHRWGQISCFYPVLRRWKLARISHLPRSLGGRRRYYSCSFHARCIGVVGRTGVRGHVYPLAGPILKIGRICRCRLWHFLGVICIHIKPQYMKIKTKTS